MSENRTLLYFQKVAGQNCCQCSCIDYNRYEFQNYQMAFWLFIYFGQPPNTQLP